MTTADGHLLCLGCTLPSSLKGMPAAEVCRLAHAAGGMAVAPHPYDLFRAGIRESVLDGQTGFLAPHGDVDALAAAMGRLAGSRELVESMGLRAREFSQSFTWDNAATETEAHLRAVAR